MILSKEQVIQTLGEKISLTLADVSTIKAAYDNLDLDTLRTEALARVTVENWKSGDKASTGVLFEDAHPSLKGGGAAYSVYIDGKRTYFQYDNPFSSDPLTSDNVEAVKQKHIDNIVDGLVNERLVDEVLKQV